MWNPPDEEIVQFGEKLYLSRRSQLHAMFIVICWLALATGHSYIQSHCYGRRPNVVKKKKGVSSRGACIDNIDSKCVRVARVDEIASFSESKLVFWCWRCSSRRRPVSSPLPPGSRVRIKCNCDPPPFYTTSVPFLANRSRPGRAHVGVLRRLVVDIVGVGSPVEYFYPPVKGANDQG